MIDSGPLKTCRCFAQVVESAPIQTDYSPLAYSLEIRRDLRFAVGLVVGSFVIRGDHRPVPGNETPGPQKESQLVAADCSCSAAQINPLD